MTNQPHTPRSRFLAHAAAGLLTLVATGAFSAEDAGAEEAGAEEAGTTAVFRVYDSGPAVRALLGREFAHVKVDAKHGDLIVEANAAQRAILEQAGLKPRMDMELSARVGLADLALSKSIPGFACYRTVSETNALITNLVAANPNLATVIDIGDSWRKSTPTAQEPGFDLRVLKLTNSAIAGPKPRMFVMSGLHAREYTPVEVNATFAEWLLNNYQTDATARWLLDYNEFHLLLQANPDGRIIAESGQSQRKNRRDHGGCSGVLDGVDLNRNFQIDWTGSGSSTSLCNETYRGTAVLSEPESTAVNSYIASIFPDTRPGALSDYTQAAAADTQGLYLDVHSYSEVVLWPWGFPGSTTAPNNAPLRTLGRRFAFFNSYSPEQSNTIPASGASDDNAYGSLGVPAYTFELGDDFFQDCATFTGSIQPGNLAAFQYGARILSKPYQMPSGPDALNVRVQGPSIVFPGESVMVLATIDDTRFNQSNGTETTQNISSARVYVDQLPWAAGAIGQTMLAADGSFNQTSEGVSLNLPSTGLSLGQHLLLVQGTDASTIAGPPGAAFLTISDPASVGQLQGTVTSFVSGTPLEATLTLGAEAVVSGVNGGYTHRKTPGVYSLLVSKPGYLDEAATGISLTAGQITTRDIAMYPTCAAFADDAETVQPAWTASGTWARASQTGPTGAATMVWSDSPAGNYGDNANMSLTSGVLSYAGLDGVRLAFDHRCNTEATFDFGRVEVSTNGGTNWTQVFQCDGANGWRHEQIELPTIANQANVRFRFRFTSDTGQVADGWQLDNIRIESAGPACRATQLATNLFANDFE
ncbi:peptidase M14 [Ahniella affigens]|uniref:Peptidase M14 n=1 Tax=Ahniella affigens TaxID=2021234 RepID=A0A2P1PP97_9GAMM|nr:M14 family zinc carboxypeptidase [Ahniella affigens]AVP96662.1 peptidase M14 [Ahniella affigens]